MIPRPLAAGSFILEGDNEKYLKILPNLKENAIFPTIPPSELQDFLSQRREEPSSRNSEPLAQESIQSSEPSTARFHLSVSEAVLLSGSASNNMIGAFNSSGFGGTVVGWFGPTTYPVDYSNSFSWNVAGEYSITDHLQLGLARSNFPQQEIHGKDEEYEYANGISYSVMCGYVLFPAAPLFASRSEFAIAAGVSYNSLSVDGTMSSIFGSAYLQNPISFAVNKNVLGLHARASYDYYFSEYFSLQCKLEGKLIPSVDVPAVSHTNPVNHEVKTLMQHSVDFSGIDFSLGVRCHL